MNGVEQRARTIRRHALMAIHAAASGHPGGCLSCADLLAHLWRPQAPPTGEPGRDAFILSKGHAAPALYAAAAGAGVIAPSEQGGLRKLGSSLQGHPSVRSTPWALASTGSLGQGFSVALGLALGWRYRGRKERVFALLGDGELQEGQVWETAMCAAHHRLGKLVAIVDYNKMQSDATNAEILALEPLAAKWRAFGWRVSEIDGHDHGAIAAALDWARRDEGAPAVIIAHTVKGQGVGYMAGSPAWHGSVRLSDDDLARALRDLGMGEAEIARALEGRGFE